LYQLNNGTHFISPLFDFNPLKFGKINYNRSQSKLGETVDTNAALCTVVSKQIKND